MGLEPDLANINMEDINMEDVGDGGQFEVVHQPGMESMDPGGKSSCLGFKPKNTPPTSRVYNTRVGGVAG